MSINKRIFKNSLYLYIRMLIIMVIQFFTVRITLRYLGVEDYGIYNVVCGVTNVFTFLTHTMTSASQRFLAYDLGKNDFTQLKKTFDTLTALFTICGLIGVLLLGTIGYWFITTKLNIPEGRMDAAVYAFYFTLLSLFISIYTLPYNSLIIAHEEMKTFAYISVIDSILKLLIVYCLTIVPIDRLILYSALLCLSYLIPSSIYITYCYKKYNEVNFNYEIEWKLLKKIIPFMSWNLIGGLSWMLCTQGLSIIINIFFGPIANAAKAIADKVNSAIYGFANNFMMAAQPQIVKTYACNDITTMHNVIYMTSKISFFLMLVLSLPIIINANDILKLWLSSHDELTTIMLQLVLLFSLINSLENPISQAIRATGEIRNYQIYIGIITLLVIPVTYIFFKIGKPAYYGYIALTFVYSFAYILRLHFLKKQIHITYSKYITKVLLRCCICLLINIPIQYFLVNHTKHIHTIILWLICCFISISVIFIFGLTKKEQNAILKLFVKIRK